MATSAANDLDQHGAEPDSGRRASTDYRSFEWFTPKKRRASLYEDVTADTQPSIERYWTAPYPVHFEDGRGVWWEGSTRLRSTDWYAFRDPREDWERTYYQSGAGYERDIENALGTAADDRLYDHFPEPWIEFLRDNLQVMSFVDYGLWLPLAGAQRDCLSDTLAHAVGMVAGAKQRQYQAVILYGLELEQRFEGFEVSRAKERFLEHEPYQPLRAYVERVNSITDWCEQIVAINLCYEAIVGVALRREVLMRSAAAYGDVVTGQVVRPAQSEYASSRVWTEELIRFSLGDEQHGRANREVIASWIDDWGTAAKEALAALEPVFQGLPEGESCPAVADRVAGEFDEILVRAGMTEPHEVAS